MLDVERLSLKWENACKINRFAIYLLVSQVFTSSSSLDIDSCARESQVIWRIPTSMHANLKISTTCWDTFSVLAQFFLQLSRMWIHSFALRVAKERKKSKHTTIFCCYFFFYFSTPLRFFSSSIVDLELFPTNWICCCFFLLFTFFPTALRIFVMSVGVSCEKNDIVIGDNLHDWADASDGGSFGRLCIH